MKFIDWREIIPTPTNSLPSNNHYYHVKFIVRHNYNNNLISPFRTTFIQYLCHVDSILPGFVVYSLEDRSMMHVCVHDAVATSTLCLVHSLEVS